MKTGIEMRNHLVAKAEGDSAFRARLLEDSQSAIEQEFGVTLPQGHAVEVHEETDTVAHLVLPAKSRFSEADRKAAMTGETSLEYLRKTLSNPAPPARPPVERPAAVSIRNKAGPPEALAKAGRAAIRSGLEFLETAVAEDGSWHAIRYMLSDPRVPGTSKRRLSPPRLERLRWNAAATFGPRPFAPARGRIFSAASSIPECGATGAICPPIWTARRSVHSPSGLTPGSSWAETSSVSWRIAARTAAS